MAARDQRGKGQQQHPTQQGASNGGARREEEYNNGYGNVYQGGYSSMVNSNGDAYFPSYNPYQMSYPQNIFGDSNSTWSASNDALGYLGGYNAVSTDPSFGMFPSYDYSQQAGYNAWGGYGDYNSWNSQTQTNGVKTDQTQYQQSFPGYTEPDFYQTPTSSTAQPPSMTSPGTELTSPNGLSANGLVSNGLEETAASENGAVELEQGLQNMTVSNGESETISPDLSTEPSSSSTSLTAQTTAQTTTTAQQLSPQSNHPSTQPPQPGKPLSWAQLASQPARPTPPKPAQPKVAMPAQRPTSQPAWVNGGPRNPAAGDQRQSAVWNGQRPRIANGSTGKPPMNSDARKAAAVKSESELDPTLNKLRKQNKYNPPSMEIDMKNARFFVIKSYSEDDIHRAIKYAVWCSTDHGNRRLDQAFKQQAAKGPIYLFYSVNGSGHFCGVAQMLSGVDYDSSANVWTQDKWKGKLEIKWIYVKDVPNNQLRHIRLENNENKPVTNSRDTQEVPYDKGKQVMGIIHKFKHTTSIFDDFSHYEKKEEEEDSGREKPNIAGTDGQPPGTNNATAARR